MLREVFISRLRAQSERDHYPHAGYIHEKQRDNPEDNEGQKILDEATAMLDRVKIMRVFDMAGLIESLAEIGEVEKPLQTSRPREVGDSDEDSGDESLDAVDAVQENPGQLGRSAATRTARSVNLITVSSITNVISSVVSKNAIQGQAILASFMRSLRHLTLHFQLCTIIVNATVRNDSQTLNRGRSRGSDVGVSAFASVSGMPALGLSFTHMVDTSVLVSKLPKNKVDASLAYGSNLRSRQWQNAFIMEVLKDRCGTREGSWAAFEIVSNVKLAACFS